MQKVIIIIGRPNIYFRWSPITLIPELSAMAVWRHLISLALNSCIKLESFPEPSFIFNSTMIYFLFRPIRSENMLVMMKPQRKELPIKFYSKWKEFRPLICNLSSHESYQFITTIRGVHFDYKMKLQENTPTTEIDAEIQTRSDSNAKHFLQNWISWAHSKRAKKQTNQVKISVNVSTVSGLPHSQHELDSRSVGAVPIVEANKLGL